MNTKFTTDTKLESEIAYFENINLKLESGDLIDSFKLAFKTYGKLNTDRTNAILVCHALTGDQYVAGNNPITGREGWWSRMVGPNKPIDTNKFFVICSNVLGGCAGSTGPKELQNGSDIAYGGNFPSVTIKDMVKAQSLLIESLNIEKLFSVIGGSMGAMQALQWAIDFPDKILNIIHIAGALKHSAQNIAFHEVGRQAIMSDPIWKNGKYFENNEVPERGLSVARMIAHITYLSENAMHRKFGRKLQSRDIISFGFDADFQVESYLRYQGKSFVERFDANSYLYLTRAMDYFDHDETFRKNVEFSHNPNKHLKYLIVSFTSDWLFPTIESKIIVNQLNSLSREVSFLEIDTDKGHDSFLLEEPQLDDVIKGFLTNNFAKIDG